MKQDLSNRTVRRCLNEKNYQYLQCRKKGLLNTEDMKSRLAFAKKINRLLPKEFWQKGIYFYIDGVGWAHKVNPSENAKTYRTRRWRKKAEGLSINCTAKGRKEGTGKCFLSL